jgi:RsiW-degrading membrane proteinase PrsW (M82 family)
MATSEHKLAAAFDPRVKMYRDPFNEQLVFTLSAAGATFGVPIMLLVAGLILGKFSAIVFVVASVLLEWFHIFVVGRPQMKPNEAVAWAALWGSVAAFFGVCFYYWVFVGAV